MGASVPAVDCIYFYQLFSGPDELAVLIDILKMLIDMLKVLTEKWAQIIGFNMER